ncbi:methyltransferase [Streptomyces sp. NPDC093544]|jgi:phosphatidylethanolamine/phosphatidyl-N-methylethanolamine N-methyltransferase|uniref:class I SAM-dependent methyltransferase n=1 Tax=Streptomyces sp. NPDC093544 TaxID=3155200 RepID=UPI003430DD58
MTPTASAALAEALAFLRQFSRTAKMTGSVAPSGAALSRALTRHIHPGTPHHPRAVLEVGPGTGAVTRHLAPRLGPHDTLELIEANGPFVDHLTTALQHDLRLAAIAHRTRLHHGLIQDQKLGHYDNIVCGLPFANFPPPQIEAVLGQLLSSLRPGGRLSFFTYLGGRAIQHLNPRQALSRHVLREAIAPHVVGSEIVLSNLPPAYVHHLLAPAPVTCHCGALDNP